MSRRLVLGVVMAVSMGSACADILGIDDGKERTEDATAPDSNATDATGDVTLADVAADVPDVVVEAATSPLACGASTCNALAEACCRMGDALDAGAQTFACVAADAGCAGLRVTCDDPSNCTALGHPGDVCCGEVEGGVTVDTACVAPGSCGGVVVCAPGDDEVCADDAGTTCQPSSKSILGFDICK